MSVLAERLLAVHRALDGVGVAHAFGGAIALAYCTEEPRGTRDLDVNVFVGVDRAGDVLGSLPEGTVVTDSDVAAAVRDGQVRVWWEDTPVDVFFDVHDFHREVAAAVRTVPFAGTHIPVLDCLALVVFKALFNRTKDWADIEATAEAMTFDVHEALAWVVRLGGPDHLAVSRLASLASTSGGEGGRKRAGGPDHGLKEKNRHCGDFSLSDPTSRRPTSSKEGDSRAVQHHR